jgi:hypothetical protein
MKNATTLFLASILALTLTACGGGGNSGGGSSTPDVTPVDCTGDGIMVKAAKANNYQFSSTLTFPPINVKPNTELNFDWSGVSRDFLGHDVNPKTDLNMISLLSWNLPLKDLETNLNADTLRQADLTVVPLTLTTDGNTAGVSAGATSAKLYTFTLNGGVVTPDQLAPYFDADNYPPITTTYTLMAATGTVVGQGVRMIQSFLLDKSSSNTDVKMTSDSTKLTYSANLHTLTPTGIKPGTGDITFDWTDMTETALGTNFDPTSITYALVGHYTQGIGDLENKFLDIQLIATELYEGTISIGTSIKLSDLKDKNGNPFAGIDNTGTWVVALQCGACHNPAPWYLSTLRICPKS